MQDINKIIRAWKDADYRLSLTDEDRTALPEHPAGLVELSDADLNHAAGGSITSPLCIPTILVDTCPTALLCSALISCG